MKNVIWRVFQFIEICGGEELKIFFSLLFVFDLIISNTYVSHQRMCHWIQICQSNIQILKYTQGYVFYFQQYVNNVIVRILCEQN